MRQGEKQVSWESEIRRAERANTSAFIVTVVLAIAVAAALIVSGAACRFSREKWAKQPSQRTRIVSDLLRRSDPTGKTLAEVRELLGAGEVQALDGGAFTLRYPLGVDPVFVPNGDAVLEIEFHGGTAASCRVCRK